MLDHLNATFLGTKFPDFCKLFGSTPCFSLCQESTEFTVEMELFYFEEKNMKRNNI